jgi:hypothetical protein
MLNISFGAGNVGAVTASLYGSGSSSAKMMRLLEDQAPQHEKELFFSVQNIILGV